MKATFKDAEIIRKSRRDRRVAKVEKELREAGTWKEQSVKFHIWVYEQAKADEAHAAADEQACKGR